MEAGSRANLRPHLSDWKGRWGTWADHYGSKLSFFPENIECVGLGRSFRSSSWILEFRTSLGTRTPKSLWRGTRDLDNRRCRLAIELQLSLLDPSFNQFIEDPDVERFSVSRLSFQLHRYLDILEGSHLLLELFVMLPQRLLFTMALSQSRVAFSRSWFD